MFSTSHSEGLQRSERLPQITWEDRWKSESFNQPTSKTSSLLRPVKRVKLARSGKSIATL